MSICPEGHRSESDDYCDVCGTPIPPGSSAVASAPPSAAAAATPPARAGIPCPHCGVENVPDALFCEACGYDFTTGTLPRPIPNPFALPGDEDEVPPAPAAPPAQAAQPAPAAPATPSAAAPVAPASGISPVDGDDFADFPAVSSEGSGYDSPSLSTPSPGGSDSGGLPAGGYDSPAAAPVAPRADTAPADAAPDDTAPADTAPDDTAAADLAAAGATPGSGTPEGDAGTVPGGFDAAPAAPASPSVADEAGSLDAAPPPAVSVPASPAVPEPESSTFEWVAEVWIDPDWYRKQTPPDPMPSPGLPEVVPLRRRSILIGRVSRSRNIHPDIDCDADPGASRRQAQLTTDGRRWWIEDLDSANGTYVAGAADGLPDEPIRVGQRRELDPDDRVYLGAWTRLVIRRATEEEQEAY